MKVNLAVAVTYRGGEFTTLNGNFVPEGALAGAGGCVQKSILEEHTEMSFSASSSKHLCGRLYMEWSMFSKVKSGFRMLRKGFL